MKWFQRAEFEKNLRRMEKELNQSKQNVSYYSDYELQRYFQRLKRIEKLNKQT